MAIHAAYFPLCLASIACLCPLALLLESSSFPLRYPTDQSDSTFESGGLSSPGCRCCGPSRNNNNNVDDDNNNVKNKKKRTAEAKGWNGKKEKKIVCVPKKERQKGGGRTTISVTSFVVHSCATKSCRTTLNRTRLEH